MKNLLILYNPYYNQEMIEDHIRILSAVNEPIEAKVVDREQPTNPLKQGIKSTFTLS